MATRRVDRVSIGVWTEFRKSNDGIAYTPDANGLVTVPVANGAQVIVITAGSTLRGLRVEDDSGAAVVPSPGHLGMVILRSSSTVPVTISHEDVTVSATDRFSVSDGEDTVIDNKHTQFFYDGEISRWLANDWPNHSPV